MDASPLRIAMWSGPRNISTAMLRSFASRGDCAVVDEPLYAVYLRTTGLAHPGRGEVLAAQSDDWRVVADQLTEVGTGRSARSAAAALHDHGGQARGRTGGQVQGRTDVVYVKHMAHHLLDDVGRRWLEGWRHAFLIRDPAAMLLSLDEVLGWTPTVRDTGLDRQVELHRRFGGPVVRAEDVLADPAATLAGLCRELGIPWTEAMLSWPAGPHPADGVWAPHWYAAVWASTGFAPPRAPVTTVPAHLHDVHAECVQLHAQLAEHAASGGQG